MPITNRVIFQNSNGNVGIGNNAPTHTLRVEGSLSATGNANLGNIGATRGVFTNISGTLETAAQTNITSLGTLTSLAVTGNITSGNVSGTRGAFTNVAGTLETAAQTNITSLGTLSTLTVSGNATFDTNTLFVDSVNNRVGVGTTSPSYTLDVTGSVRVNGQPIILSDGSVGISGNAKVSITSGSANLSGISIGVYSDGASFIESGNFTAYTSMLIQPNGGNVGIGNTAPAHKLSVTGTANISGNTTVANLITGNLTLGSDALTSSHHTITIDPSTSGVGGNVIIQGNLQVTGTTTTVNSTTVEVSDLNITLAKDAGNASQANGAGLTVAGASATMTYASTGDKWTFNKPLDVTGSLTTSTTLSVTGNANVGNLGATNITGTLLTAAQTNVTSLGTLSALTVSGNAFLATSSGSVGIGTTSPVGKLDVQGGRSYFAASNEAYAVYLRYNTSTNGVWLGSPSADAFQISKASGSAILNIDSSGNVGVGTSSPRSILNTNVGTITGPAVTPGLMLTSVYSGVTAVNSIDWNYSGQTTSPVRLGATFNSDGAGMEMVFYTSTSYTSNGSERMRLNKDGNLGVGTASPGYRLHVVNNSDTSIAYYSIAKNDGGSADGFQIVDDRGFAGVNSGKTFRVLTRNDGTNDTGAIASFETVGGSSSTRMRINIDGNVGIGNSAPTHTLRVEGTLSATGDANVGNLGTTGSITASGNVTGNYILGNGSLLSGIITSVANINLGTSNVTVVSSGGNITVGVGGTNNVAVFATTGEYITGVLSVTGNANVGNIGATRGVFTNISGTLETAAQTNITSLGTLTSLSVTGNANVGNIGATNGVFTNVSGSGSAMTSLPAGNLTGTIPSGVLGNSSHFIGTTSIALNRASANQSLTGITSLVMPGSTSGNVTLQPAATAGTTTITLPATTGTVVTTGDSGTVTSTMIADGTIVNGDINASAAIAVSKLAASTISGVTLGNNLNTLTLNTSGTGLSGSTTYNGSGAATFTVTSNATSANTVSAIVARDGSGNFSAGTITATLSGTASSATLALSIPQSAKSADYTLAIGDRGYHISISAGNITVPASVFSAGDAITIYNNAATNRTIIQGASTTVRLAGTANTGNRTLAQYGVATVLCVASNTFVISGNGLT